jgi:hypothetical protein
VLSVLSVPVSVSVSVSVSQSVCVCSCCCGVYCDPPLSPLLFPALCPSLSVCAHHKDQDQPSSAIGFYPPPPPPPPPLSPPLGRNSIWTTVGQAYYRTWPIPGLESSALRSFLSVLAVWMPWCSSSRGGRLCPLLYAIGGVCVCVLYSILSYIIA